MQIAKIAPRFTVKIADIEAARKEGVKCWINGDRALFSREKPKGNWSLIGIPVSTNNQPEAA